jgi:hypothetical protein
MLPQGMALKALPTLGEAESPSSETTAVPHTIFLHPQVALFVSLNLFNLYTMSLFNCSRKMRK